MPSPSFTVCQCVTGRPDYFAVAEASMASVARHTDATIVIATHNPSALRACDGIPTVVAEIPPQDTERASPFLAKFEAIRAGLERTAADTIMLLDADTRIVRRTIGDDVRRALGHHDFAMVEQPGIRGSRMSRAEFLAHYTEHSLAFISPGESPPGIDEFRFFNSGVVLGRREAWADLLAFTDERMATASGAHEVGEHFIADQDYLQYWTNTHKHGCCADLPPEWNHCALWHNDFPRRDSRILHFSNFCNGPDADGIATMNRIARAATRRARLRHVLRSPFRARSGK